MRYGLSIGNKPAAIRVALKLQRWSMSWLDGKYRILMLWSMLVELVLLAAIVAIDAAILWLEYQR